MPTPSTKSERFNTRFDPETLEMLRELAEESRESQSSVVRRLVRKEWARSRKKLRQTP